ncbi:hypothetical protein CPC08DRAFT_753199 [Agrocybe pediades]|nr:hypothetical protein CPC08DRAFT_753199 [Agrocybe pediades]
MQGEPASAATVNGLFTEYAYSFLALATGTCVIYDHITTLDIEIEMVWKRPKFSVVQLLFLINRYVGNGLQIHTAFTLVRHVVNNTVDDSAELTFYQVMYNHDRRVIYLLVFAWASECISLVTIQTISKRILNMLSVSLAIKHYASIRKYPRVPLHSSRPSLIYILLRDSITFPFIYIVILLVNIAAGFYLHYQAVQMMLSLATFAPCIIGPRLILNLRELYYQPFRRECSALPELNFLEEDEDSGQSSMNPAECKDQ